MGKLIDTKLRKLKPEASDKRYADGGGLYLLIRTDGKMFWRYDYRRKSDGARKTASFGEYPKVSLSDARNKHADAHKLVRDGGDPAGAKKEVKEKARADEIAGITFGDLAKEWLDNRVPEERDGKRVRGQKTSARDRRNVNTYLNPELRHIAIKDLKLRHLSDVLVKCEEAQKFETRVRVQGTAKAIMGYAVGRGYIDANPFLGVAYADAFTSPSQKRVKRPALTNPESFGNLLRRMAAFEGRDGNLTGYALELLALTFVRPHMVAQAEWSEVYLSDDPMEAKWVIPADKLKMDSKRQATDDDRAGEALEVPLSLQAVTLLRRLRKLTGESRHLFPGRQTARFMSENTMNYALIAMGYQKIHCAHGFRSSASHMLNKERMTVEGKRVLRWPEQGALIEVQLDHNDASTRAIYMRGGAWGERVELMQLWADRIDEMRAGKQPGFLQAA